MNDNVLSHLQEAKNALKKDSKNNRGLTEIESAILLRQDDLLWNIRSDMQRKGFTLESTVFPSEEKTISVIDDFDGGAHLYEARYSTGFQDSKALYLDEGQYIQFVKKNYDGSITPGLQSEQLVLILIDRTKKLNARFPSIFNDKMILGLNMFLEACKECVEDRINHGVMGDL